MRHTRKPKSKYVKLEALPKGSKGRIELLCNEPIKKKYLDRAISLMTHAANEKKGRTSMKHCVDANRFCDSGVKSGKFSIFLKARYATHIVNQLRTAILLSDWETAAKLLLLVFHTGTRQCKQVIIKAGVLILMNHPRSSHDTFMNFLRRMTQYTEEDTKKLMVLLSTLRKSLLEPFVFFKVRAEGINLVDNVAITGIDFGVGKNEEHEETL